MPTPPLSQETAQEALDAFQNYGTQLKAAEALGISRATLQSRLRTANARAREGHAPGHFNNGVAPGYLMGKVTVQRGPEGGVERTWERQSPDAVSWAKATQEAAEAMAEDLPRLPPVRAPLATLGELCNLYTFTDYHLGMMAWREEGGADWDLKIAEQTLTASFAAMVEQSPAAHTAVINLQGDLLHTDGLMPVTPGHGHVLDADSRYSKMVAVAIRAVRQLVAMALARHSEVHLVICEGNHDESSAVWLRLMFSALYENEPRITVNASELPFYLFTWGKTFLGFHHGHKVKNEQLPLLFAAQFRAAWGATTKAYIHCGHRHHCDEKEYSGATVVQHPTLAARDAYAARGGWIAERAAQSITYSKRFGQVGRVFVTPEMMEAA